MSFRSEERQLGDYVFQVHTLPYGISQKVLMKAKELLMIKVADTGAFEDGASPLSACVFMDLDESNLEFVVAKLAEHTRVKQVGSEYLPLSSQKEIVFAGRMELMFQWLDLALEVSFGNFLGDLKKVANKQMEKGPGSLFQKK